MSTRNVSEPSSSSPGLDASTNTRSPRTGSAAAPVSLAGYTTSGNPSISVVRRRRSSGYQPMMDSPASVRPSHTLSASSSASSSSLIDSAAKAQSRSARKINDAMVYLDGPQIYTCAQCRTHLTSHDEIISKSFHGRHGRAYLFDHCVNVSIGPPEDRLLITGLHSVCDIFCKRCKTMVGWTYAKAYETSQKYKEGKFIVEKINLHLEESDYYDVATPAGERKDRFRARSISWGSDCQKGGDRQQEDTIYEYHPTSPVASAISRISHR